jgi:antitoxin (DNA-binding transcriptional repressor) of toxin-antitoxin stability system
LLGEEIIIARDNQPLVKPVPLPPVDGKRFPGSGKGQLIKMAVDFDSPADDFEDKVALIFRDPRSVFMA